MLARTLGEHIDMHSTLEPELWPVRLGAGQIEQVLINLAVNSRDAMPGGGRLEIKTENVELDAEPRTASGRCRPADTRGSRCSTPARGWIGRSPPGHSIPSSRPSRPGRAPAWGSPPCTGSSSRQADTRTSIRSRVGHRRQDLPARVAEGPHVGRHRRSLRTRACRATARRSCWSRTSRRCAR